MICTPMLIASTNHKHLLMSKSSNDCRSHNRYTHQSSSNQSAWSHTHPWSWVAPALTHAPFGKYTEPIRLVEHREGLIVTPLMTVYLQCEEEIRRLLPTDYLCSVDRHSFDDGRTISITIENADNRFIRIEVTDEILEEDPQTWLIYAIRDMIAELS